MGVIRQASCVAVAGRAMLIEGPPGSGKSTLALMLIDRGGVLVGDDGVTLAVTGGVLVASPPPNIAGLLEIRNVGLVSFATCSAPVALRLVLDEDAPRFVEGCLAENIEGVAIPTLAFDPRGPAGAIRAEQALRLHGLSHRLPHPDTL